MQNLLVVRNDDFLLLYENNDIVFRLEDIEKIKDISTSLNVVFGTTITKESGRKFLCVYDKLFKEKGCDIIINLNNKSDDEIISSKDVLKELESKTSCLFGYRYDIYPTATLDEIFRAIDFIEKQAQIVKYYNFSALEALIFIYDMVRDREYVHESEEEGVDKSRNLSKIIFSDKLVCAGYANMFSAIANKCDIYTENLSWENSLKFHPWHCSNICYVNDLRYDVHGVIEIDATYGRKKSANDNCYLDDYSSFARSILGGSIKNRTWNLKYLIDYNNLIYCIDKYYKQCVEFSKIGGLLFERTVCSFVKKVNYYFSVVGFDCDLLCEVEEILNNGEEISIIVEKLDELYDIIYNNFYNHSIEFDKFFSAIYNVRRVEHSINSCKYSFSLEDLHDISINYYGFIEFVRNFDFLLNYDSDRTSLDANRMKLIYTLRKIKNKY